MLPKFARETLQRVALRCGFNVTRLSPFERAIRRIELAQPEFLFLQVGAFNGVTSDPFVRLISPDWKCILVEPQERHFAILELLYHGQDNVSCVNCAVSDEESTATLFTVREDVEGMPHWAPQLASFRKDVISSHRFLIPDLDEQLMETRVACRTLKSLLDQHQFPHLDLLAIDVEGYDFEVIRQIDTLDFPPKLIYYEHHHLGDADYAASLEFLAERGYRTQVVNKFDTFAQRIA